MGHHRPTSLLLNIGHAIDHMFLLIFATAVASIAAEFGFSHWEDLMPYSVGAFFLFGLGSLPSGRLGDLWGTYLQDVAAAAATAADAVEQGKDVGMHGVSTSGNALVRSELDARGRV